MKSAIKSSSSISLAIVVCWLDWKHYGRSSQTELPCHLALRLLTRPQIALDFREVKKVCPFSTWTSEETLMVLRPYPQTHEKVSHVGPLTNSHTGEKVCPT